MPLTADRPKAVVEIGGTTLAARAASFLQAAGAGRIVAVTGYRADRISELEIETLYNERHSDAENIYSLWKARELVKGGCLIVNSDVIFEPRIAELLLVQKNTAVLCDDTHSRDEEAMKAVARHGRLRSLSKDAPLGDNDGEYIGLTRVDPADGSLLVEVLDRFVARGEVQVYYENAIEELAQETPVAVVSVAGLAWAEIDDHDDLAYAEREIVGRADGARS